MLFNIHTLDWDDEILKVLDIPRCMLPQPMPSSCFYEYAGPHALRGRHQDRGAAGDQQAALFGQPAGPRARPRTPSAPAALC